MRFDAPTRKPTMLLLAVASIMLDMPAGGQGPVVAAEEVRLTLKGVVRGPDGHPVPGATVWLPSYYGAVKPERLSKPGGGALTDAEGRYALAVSAEPAHLAAVFERGVSAQADGFVRLALPYELRPTSKAGETLTLDIELEPGKALAGVVDVPMRLAQRLEGERDEGRRYMLRVSGGSFSQTHYVPREFALWVPEGRYDIGLVHDGQGARLDAPSGRLKDVTAGTRDLRVVRDDPNIAPETLERAFDALWQDMFWYYSYFELKRVDWAALKTKYRPRAVAAATLPRFVDVLGEMLGELDDGHVGFAEPADAVVAYRPVHIPADQNFAATEATIAGSAWVGNGFARVGTTRIGGFGVVRIVRMSRADDAAVEEIVKFIRDHADAPGFVVDLRGADGGGEEVGLRIAGQFCAKDVVYARSKYRGGPGPGDFGSTYDRVLGASKTPFTKPVVCVLGPGCVSSGEAFAKMMRRLPHVTTVGRTTRGSSGNPRPCSLPGLPVTVFYSRWVDMLPDGQPVEGRGVPPETLVDLPEAAYKEGDPTWEKALELLRAMAGAGKEAP